MKYFIVIMLIAYGLFLSRLDGSGEFNGSLMDAQYSYADATSAAESLK